jgi:hypothetical protein
MTRDDIEHLAQVCESLKAQCKAQEDGFQVDRDLTASSAACSGLSTLPITTLILTKIASGRSATVKVVYEYSMNSLVLMRLRAGNSWDCV